MKINFRLNKKNKNDKTGFLRMDFSYTGKRFRYFFGISLPDNHWSNTKQRVKSSVSNSLEINKRLSEVEKDIIKIYYELINNNITPSNAMLKQRLDESLRGISSQLSFYEFVVEFIKRSANTKKPSTIKEYNYTINDLKTFEKHIKRRIECDTIDMKFYDAYMDYQYNVKGNILRCCKETNFNIHWLYFLKLFISFYFSNRIRKEFTNGINILCRRLYFI
jgi:hypothetical protein